MAAHSRCACGDAGSARQLVRESRFRKVGETLPILARMRFISSKENARRVSERTLPREQTLKDSAVALSSRGYHIVGAERPIEVLDGATPLFLAISLKVSARPDRLFDIADALIGEACKQMNVAMACSYHGHPAQPALITRSLLSVP